MVTPVEFSGYVGRLEKPGPCGPYALLDIPSGATFITSGLDLIAGIMAGGVKEGARYLLQGPCPATLPWMDEATVKELLRAIEDTGMEVTPADTVSDLTITSPPAPCPSASAEREPLLPLTDEDYHALQREYEKIADVKRYPNPFLYQPRR